MPLTEQIRAEAYHLAGRYPQSRSALLPMLHLVQAEEGYVSGHGIALCAQVLDLTTAEVSAVASFYTMFRRHPVGQHHVGVCTNTLCAQLGGDAVWSAVTERLGVGHDETTPDGVFTAERIECQAACTHAPVMTVDWEYIDQVTPAGAVAVLDDLAAGRPVHSTRGPVVSGWQATERLLAGFDDGQEAAGPQADDLMLAGLRRARELGMTAPAVPAPGRTATQEG